MITPIHPDLVKHLGAFFTFNCSIQEATDKQTDSGATIQTWKDVEGMTLIGCAVGPAGGGERRQAGTVLADVTHLVLLEGAYPNITPRHRAVIGQAAYNILLVEMDPTQRLTRLQCQRVV